MLTFCSSLKLMCLLVTALNADSQLLSEVNVSVDDDSILVSSSSTSAKFNIRSYGGNILSILFQKTLNHLKAKFL